MSDTQVIKTPKYIVYEGNLYKLLDTNIAFVMDYEEALNIVQKEQK